MLLWRWRSPIVRGRKPPLAILLRNSDDPWLRFISTTRSLARDFNTPDVMIPHVGPEHKTATTDLRPMFSSGDGQQLTAAKQAVMVGLSRAAWRAQVVADVVDRAGHIDYVVEVSILLRRRRVGAFGH